MDGTLSQWSSKDLAAIDRLRIPRCQEFKGKISSAGRTSGLPDRVYPTLSEAIVNGALLYVPRIRT
jgi:hypothetical protein